MLQFCVRNAGEMDVNDVGVAVVLNDSYSTHRYVRLPWMNAGASEQFSMDWVLPPGQHQFTVIVDPEARVIEEDDRRENNRCVCTVSVA